MISCCCRSAARSPSTSGPSSPSERATDVNRLRMVPERTNLELGSVAGHVLGVSRQAIPAALSAGEADPSELRQTWPRGSGATTPPSKTPQLVMALQGPRRPNQTFVLTGWPPHIDGREETLARADAQIREAYGGRCNAAWAAAPRGTVSGIAEGTGHWLETEIGTDTSHLPSGAAAVPTWRGAAP